MDAQSLTDSIASSIVIKATALLLVAFGVNFALRKFSAALRHFVWALVLIMLLVLPVLSVALPPVNVVDRFDPSEKVTISAAPNQVVTTDPAEASMKSFGAPGKPSGDISSTGQNQIAPAMPVHALPKSATPRISLRGCLDLLAAIWLIGVAVVLSMLIVGLITTQLAFRLATLASPSTAEAIAEITKNLGIRSVVIVKVSAQSTGFDVPITWGLLKPTILLPASINDWTKQKITAALTHEAAHIARRDWFFQIAAICACALYWFHPLVWIAAKQLRRESEYASDDLVLQSGLIPTDYAQALLEIARALSKSSTTNLDRSAVIAMAQRTDLTPRLAAILDKMKNRRPLTVRTAIALLAIFIIGSVIIAAVRVVQRSQAGNPLFNFTAPKFEVVGISSGSDGGARWWDMSGNLLPNKPEGTTTPTPNDDPWLSNYDFFIKASNVGADPHIIVESTGFTKSTSCGTVVPNGIMQIEQIESDPKNGYKGSLRVGFVSSQWQDLLTIPQTELATQHSGTDPTIGKFVLSVDRDGYDNDPGEAALLLRRSLFNKVLIRCVITKTGGQTQVVTSEQATIRDLDNCAFLQLGMSKSTIKELRIQYAPYQFFTLTPPLRPGPLNGATSRASYAAGMCMSRLIAGAQLPGQASDKIPDFRAAVAADSSSPDAHYQLANALFNANEKTVIDYHRGDPVVEYYSYAPPPGNLSQALIQMSDALRLWPGNFEWSETYANYLAGAGRHQESVAEYQSTLKEIGYIAPVDMTNHPTLMNNEHSIELANKEQNYVGALSGMGEELIKLGRYKEAVSPLERLLQFNYSAYVTEFDLGNALFGCGRRAEALAAWKKCEALTKPTDYYGSQARRKLAEYGGA
jgi:beta-lactamase regulating signal transducer with metallopeptidase domain